MSQVLRSTIIKSGISHRALACHTGVQRLSIGRFLEGRQSLRLDLADRLADYFRLTLIQRR